jgi:hypothetical protein
MTDRAGERPRREYREGRSWAAGQGARYGRHRRIRGWWRGLAGLDKVRLVALGYALTGLVFTSPQVFIPPTTMVTMLVGAVGYGGLATTLVTTFARRRLFQLEPLVSPALMFFAGIALADPYTGIGLAMFTVAPQSLYGSLTTAAVRLVGICLALPLIVAMSPSDDIRTAWNSATLLGSLPQVVVTAVLMRVLLAVLQRQHDTAERIQLVIASGTQLGVAARIGGDEFAVLVANEGRGLAPTVAAQALQVLQKPVIIGSLTVHPRASIGLAVGESALNTRQLLHNADLAMYRAKSNGGSAIDYEPARVA